MQSNKIIAALINFDYMMLSRQIQALAIPSKVRTRVPLEQKFCHPCSCCEILYGVFLVLCIVESQLAGVNSKHIYNDNTGQEVSFT